MRASPLRTAAIPAEIREASLTHARLLDRFIELTKAELEQSGSQFAQESLNEMLEMMRADRRSYGMLVNLYAIDDAA